MKMKADNSLGGTLISLNITNSATLAAKFRRIIMCLAEREAESSDCKVSLCKPPPIWQNHALYLLNNFSMNALFFFPDAAHVQSEYILMALK